jgi:hypothetical protein
MDLLDAFKHEVDNAKEALASKLAVISFMECEARIDDWSDRELMSRLALVSSLEGGRDEVVEGSDDGGGVDSKLPVILLPFIKVDADDNMEVFLILNVGCCNGSGGSSGGGGSGGGHLAGGIDLILPITNRHAQLKRIVQVLHRPDVVIVIE